MPRPTTIDSQSMGRHKQQGAERAARLSLARMTSNGPLDGVSRAKVLLCCLSSWGRLIYLLLDKHVPAYVCTSRGGGGKQAGQPAYKGMRGRHERQAGEGERVGSWRVELVGHAADRQGKLASPRCEVTETMGSSDQEAAIGH